MFRDCMRHAPASHLRQVFQLALKCAALLIPPLWRFSRVPSRSSTVSPVVVHVVLDALDMERTDIDTVLISSASAAANPGVMKSSASGSCGALVCIPSVAVLVACRTLRMYRAYHQLTFAPAPIISNDSLPSVTDAASTEDDVAKSDEGGGEPGTETPKQEQNAAHRLPRHAELAPSNLASDGKALLHQVSRLVREAMSAPVQWIVMDGDPHVVLDRTVPEAMSRCRELVADLQHFISSATQRGDPFILMDLSTAFLSELSRTPRCFAWPDDLELLPAVHVRDEWSGRWLADWGNLVRDVGRTWHRWLVRELEVSGDGFDIEGVGPLRDAFVAIGVLPTSPFRWTCGCGSSQPAHARSCVQCRRRASASQGDWQCPCCLQGGLRGIPGAKATAMLSCRHCAAPHPWITAALATRSTVPAEGAVALCTACGNFEATTTSPGAPSVQSLFVSTCSQCDKRAEMATKSAAARTLRSAHPTLNAGWKCTDCGHVHSVANATAQSARSGLVCLACGAVSESAQKRLAREQRSLRMWYCEGCHGFTYSFFTSCGACRNRLSNIVPAAGKRPRGALWVPYRPWTCGCGHPNPATRLA